MNLVLTNSNIALVGVQDDLETVDMVDAIGYSTSDLHIGYNTSDAATPFEDALAAAYPLSTEVVVYLLAQHIPFTDPDDTAGVGTQLNVSRTTAALLPSRTDAEIAAGTFDYAAQANAFSVLSPNDGWLKFQMFVVGVDTVSDDYYYDSASATLIDSATGLEPTDMSVVATALSTAEINLLKTAKLSYNIAKVESYYMDSIRLGTCKDKDAWREHISTLQVGLTAAKLQFDSLGNMWNAAQIIETLENYLVINELDELI